MNSRGRRNRLASIQAIADELRQSGDPVVSPDLTSSILSRVDIQRPFLCERTRRMIWVGRAAVGASVAMIALGVALLYRWSPETSDITRGPAPASSVLRAVQSNVTQTTQQLAAIGQTSPAQADVQGSNANSGLFTTLWVEASKSSAACCSESFVGPRPSVASAAACGASPQVVMSDRFNYTCLREATGCEQSPWPPAGVVSLRGAWASASKRSLGLLDVAPLQFDGRADSAGVPK